MNKIVILLVLFKIFLNISKNIIQNMTSIIIILIQKTKYISTKK